jgi:hypothetical protein
MSTSYTANKGLGVPALNDTSYATTINADLAQLDADALGGLCVSLHETPSTSLNVAVSAGKFRKADGSTVSYAGVASQAMTLSSTNYVYLTDAGTLVVNTSGFPTGINYVPLAIVVAGSSTITSITDSRIAFASQGRAGGVMPATAVTSGSATLSAANPFVTVNFAGAVALTLPAAGSTPAGAIITVMDISGAAGTNNITISRAGADQINGTTSKVISTNYGGVRLWCDGTSNWFILP